MPKLNRIVETALYVDDLDRARDFYEAKLGLEPMLKTRTLLAYDIGGASVLLLFQRGGSLQTQASEAGSIPPHDGHGPLHVAFAIAREELTAWEETLAAHAVAIEGRTDWPRGGTSIYFRDPDGHLLELATPGLWPGY
jgi:catechol 2,3-dioxygenase-like lactoylglutathione lyase family enzyme